MIDEFLPEERSNSTAHMGPALKKLRTQHRLSLRRLAEQAGVTASYLSAVERGKTSPTIVQLSKVLEALGTDLATFFVPEALPTGKYVFRRKDMQAVQDSGRRYIFLIPKANQESLAMTEEVLFSGERPEYEQFAYDLGGVVLKGTLLLDIAGAGTTEVLPGDSFYLPAGRASRGSCVGEEPVYLITAIARPIHKGSL